MKFGIPFLRSKFGYGRSLCTLRREHTTLDEDADREADDGTDRRREAITGESWGEAKGGTGEASAADGVLDDASG